MHLWTVLGEKNYLGRTVSPRTRGQFSDKDNVYLEFGHWENLERPQVAYVGFTIFSVLVDQGD